jgi:glycerol uptake facilitator-like aquaporin
VREAGPLLNPAIGFGLLLTEFNFRFETLQYMFCPFAGSILALIFYEHVYVKTQELLNDDGDNSSAGANDSGLG